MRELCPPPHRSIGARPRPPFDFQARVKSHSPNPAKAYRGAGYKPVPRSVLRVLKVVSAARALNLICPKPMWLKCFGRVFSFAIHAGPAVRTRTKFLRELPEPSASEQASDTNIDGDCLGRRCGRAAEDHGTNSPGSGWRSFLPFAVVRSACREYWRHPAEK